MKTFLINAVVLSASLFSANAMSVDYATVVIERPVNASAEDAWKKVGAFCGIRDWLSAPCSITSGNDWDVGSVRSVGSGPTIEVLIAKTQYSYSYTYPSPNPTVYHGTVEIRPEGPKKSKIIYTMVFDQEPLGTAEAKAAEAERRRTIFTKGVENMVRIAEGK
jgi:hypothetical protein